MGIIKVFFSQNWLSFRGIFLPSAEHAALDYAYIRVYSVFMASLEIVAAFVLLFGRKKGLLFSIVVMALNAVGCVIAIALGDIFAVTSLIVRALILLFLIKLYRKE